MHFSVYVPHIKTVLTHRQLWTSGLEGHILKNVKLSSIVDIQGFKGFIVFSDTLIRPDLYNLLLRATVIHFTAYMLSAPPAGECELELSRHTVSPVLLTCLS